MNAAVRASVDRLRAISEAREMRGQMAHRRAADRMLRTDGIDSGTGERDLVGFVWMRPGDDDE